MTQVRAALAGAGTVLAIAACGVIPAPPPALDADFIPDVVSPTLDPSAASSDGFTTEQHLAVRIRVENCDGWATGSGWILSENQVVTNRHVIENGTRIEVTTYDGRDFTVLSSQVAPVADLALLTLDNVFTEVAEYEITGAQFLDPLTIIGYPSGDRLTVEEGHYLNAGIDEVDDSRELVWSVRGHVEPGSSGSAVFNDEGKVVAVVYAGDEFQRAIAWPIVWLDRLVQDPTGWQDNTASCS
ncbi:serine protease [Demequina sp.]|uniref:S1 family peptidase n=1 Tax=Demequina sp. TaxID=2050685 RepID=UPI0025C3C2FA|nr:serine protease [Demequina sp.]